MVLRAYSRPFTGYGDMAVTQTDIDNLNKAIASGERQVTIGSQSVTYRSIADLIQARNDLQTQLNAQNETQPRPRISRLYFAGRGYNKGCE